VNCTLTDPQKAIAIRRASVRQAWKMNGGHEHRRVGVLSGMETNFAVELDAAGAEVAVAGLLRVGLPPADRPCYDGDLLNGDEVRQTRHEHGHLLVYPDDPDDRRFWLVTGQFPGYRIVGWAYGSSAKGLPLEAKRAGASVAHWLPQSELEVVL